VRASTLIGVNTQGSYGVLKIMVKTLVTIQPGKAGKKRFWFVRMEKENNFPDF